MPTGEILQTLGGEGPRLRRAVARRYRKHGEKHRYQGSGGRQYHISDSVHREKSYDAMQLMKRLISLKQRYGVSLLIFAHTPKRAIKHITYPENDSPPADDVR